jgi:hypothetical protein
MNRTVVETVDAMSSGEQSSESIYIAINRDYNVVEVMKR